jgi:hypothetical protein
MKEACSREIAGCIHGGKAYEIEVGRYILLRGLPGPVWGGENPNGDVLLEAAYAVATALLVGAEARAPNLQVDLEAMETSVHDIEKQAGPMQGSREKCESIRRAADHIDDEARKIGENLTREAKRLLEHTAALRDVR